MASLFHPRIKFGFVAIVICMLVASSNMKSVDSRQLNYAGFIYYFISN